MISLNLKQISGWIDGKVIKGDENLIIKGISIDSRNIEEGCLFIPLIGKHLNGHQFIKNAFQNGAIASLTQEDLCLHELDGVIIKVSNTKDALQKLAKEYRRMFNIPCIAVTGSTGKTTTKDMIACILSRRFKVLKNKGNYNNEIGLPLTVLDLDNDIELMVLEMGMSGYGEIDKLADIVRPDVSIITNIGVSHIEKLGSREGILKAKMEITNYFGKKNILILNADDQLLYKLKDSFSFEVLYFSLKGKGDLNVYDIVKYEKGMGFKVKYKEKNFGVYLPALGIHNVYNAAAAITASLIFGIDEQAIIEGLKNFELEKMRMNIINFGDCILVNDAYNASPDSMKAALDVIIDIKADRHIAVLGNMLELGEWSERAHREIGEYISAKGIDILITVGEYAKFIADEAIKNGFKKTNVYVCSNNNEAHDILKMIIRKGDLILFKGSRGMKLEEIINNIQECK